MRCVDGERQGIVKRRGGGRFEDDRDRRIVCLNVSRGKDKFSVR